ncbi:uncharacterized protein LOC125179191 [Hyalella azteca]|uniref:Uncharacterized protein LOC125179191 n=1 Tax=Hyalella azteca TaxID=294128 RepID=A0A979FVX5_HYAAZ|nr:uncharacterized protein LOC125179191 [Hyalella azteca]
MADERRRELRRRKILENSDARRDKIFGLTKSTKLPLTLDQTNSEEVQSTPLFSTSTPLTGADLSSRPHIPFLLKPPRTVQDCSNVGTTPLSSRDSTPLVTRHAGSDWQNANDINVIASETRKVNFLLSNNGLSNQKASHSAFLDDPRLSNESDLTLGTSFNGSRAATNVYTRYIYAFAPCFLALIVCFFLQLELGHVVFNSVALPIILYECHSLATKLYLQNLDQELNNPGLWTAVLAWCGVSHVVISHCLKIIFVLRDLGPSFAMYLVTVVLWHTFLGLPADENIVTS